jgi:hypothetical protein
VQHKPVVAKTRGVRRTADDILAGFTRTSTPIPRSTTIVLVDDNVQSGGSIAALDRLLGAVRPTYAFAVAVTDSKTCADALKPRGFRIEYDEQSDWLEVERTLGAVRN